MANKPGDVVMIYQDPVTEQKPEGGAVLLELETKLSDGFELWKVSFEGENDVVSRILKSQSKRGGELCPR